MASPVASPAYSDNTCVPGRAADGSQKEIARRELPLQWEWPRRPRKDVNFRTLIERGGRVEAERWKAALESSVLTEERLEAAFQGRAFYIPAAAACDRYFLLDPSHAHYVEKARGYLDGASETLPLAACPELWVYPLSFVRQDLRSKMVHTRQASRQFKVFLAPDDWDLFGLNPGLQGRYSREARLGISKSLFPAIPEDLLSLWPSDGLPFSLPPIAVYWGMARDKMPTEVADRYDHVLRAELALFAAVALHAEAASTRRLWYLTEGVRSFIKTTLEEDVPPLERNRSIGALPMSALLEKVSCQVAIPQSWLQPRRVGVFTAMSVQWDEDKGCPLENHNRGGRSQRRVGNASRGRQHHGQSYAADTVDGGSRRPDPYANDRISAGVAESSPLVWDQTLTHDEWLTHTGAVRLLEAAALQDYEVWSVAELLSRLNKTFIREYEYVDRYKAQAEEGDERIKRLTAELETLKKRVPPEGVDVGQLQFDLQRLRRERNGLREEVEWYSAQARRYKRQRDELATEAVPYPTKYPSSVVTPMASAASRQIPSDRYATSPAGRDDRRGRGSTSPPPKARRRYDSPQRRGTGSPRD